MFTNNIGFLLMAMSKINFTFTKYWSIFTCQFYAGNLFFTRSWNIYKIIKESSLEKIKKLSKQKSIEQL
jgi:hypothetical protein